MATLQMYMERSKIDNLFEDETYREVWGHDFGVVNAVSKIRQIIVHEPGPELLPLLKAPYLEAADARILTTESGKIRSYFKSRAVPNLELLQEQHRNLVALLEQEGIEVVRLEDPSNYWTNLTFTRDVAMMTPQGVILSRFAMYFHQGDPYVTQKLMADLNVPIIGTIQGKGTLEGGSFCLLDEKTAVVGRSVRVNDVGIAQLRQLLDHQRIELIVVDLPASYIHLDEAFVPVDHDKILVSTHILPNWFLSLLIERGYTLIETDMSDPLLTNNCLALEPGKVLFPIQGVKTMANLRAAGVEVVPIDLSEINKLGGSIHCATLEVLRAKN